MIIAFTGHRDRLCNDADLLAIEAQYPGATWVHGGAVGFDAQVHRVAQALGKSEKVGTIIVVRPDYHRHVPKVAPLRRNEYIVDRAAVLYACYDGRKRGGTLYTINYAKRMGVSVVVLQPVAEEVNR